MLKFHLAKIFSIRCMGLFVYKLIWKIYSQALHAFLMINTLISNTRLKLSKNQAVANQHPGAELLLFEDYQLPSSILSSKNNMTYSLKNEQKNKWDYEIILLLIMKMKNRSHIYNMNRPRPIHRHEHT